MKRNTWIAVLCAAPLVVSAQQFDAEPHRPAATELIKSATRDSAAYQRLGRLVDGFGHRMSGSESLERAIDWIIDEMKKDGLENVHTEPVTVTHWVRGEESAELVSPRQAKLHMLGLGRSVGTAAEGVRAPVLVVRSFAELRARASEARGRIIVYNVPFDTTIAPFTAYGRAVVYRAVGADSASAVGAVATLVRSVTPRSLRTPHTGGMAPYDTTGRLRRIPAAAISVEDAEMLQRMQDRGERVEVRLKMGARTLMPARSHNVVAEIRGSERPEEVIVMGGHIDSWDVGQGAVDDGGGSVAAWEALRLIKQLGVRPKRTVRVVLWTNEEIGLAGGNAYRDAHRAEVDKHVLAMESDNGVFRPRAIRFGGGEGGLAVAQKIASLLAPIGVDSAGRGGPEADISPLFALGVPAITIDTDQSRYFWYHHTDADTLDKLDPADVARCVAVLAVVANTVANMDGTLPRARQ
ncbi:MAG TPA: M28 family metallopeptidase [Gemmatimonadaceae bacterium]|nr:M28 family metallopeptidase [Gemmatimonadaceae bacterium]